MLLKISKVIAITVLFAVNIAAAPEKLDYARILSRGCSIESSLMGFAARTSERIIRTEPKGTISPLWLSQRNNRWKALKDCDDLLTSMDKMQAEARKANRQKPGESDRGYRREGK